MVSVKKSKLYFLLLSTVWSYTLGITMLFCLMKLLTFFRVIRKIFDEVDEHIEKETLIKELNMRFLPDLYGKFVELIDLLV